MRISDWSSDVCSSDLSAQAQQDVAATGLIALRNVLALLDERLGEGPYTLGNQFSLCDLYLFVFVLWSRRPVLDGKLGTLSHLDAFGERLSARRSEEHTSELQSLMRISYAVFCLKKKIQYKQI